MTNVPGKWSVGQNVAMACLLESIAPKPGNVHRGADFEDLTLLDFATSAIAIAPVFDLADQLSLGQLVMKSVKATQDKIATNSNLGICLMLAPLAKAIENGRLSQTLVRDLLNNLTVEDSENVYTAIRQAQAGGMGTVDQGDIQHEAPEDLIVAMRLAESRDLIARQYANGFDDLFGEIVPELKRQVSERPTTQAIVATHLFVMSQFPDTLIQRKCGQAVADQSAAMAADAYRALGDEALYLLRLSELDFWLREDGHRRNPGTSADMICAGLFTLLVNGELEPRFD